MKTLADPEAILIDVESIRPFIRRSREVQGFARLVESIRVDGLKMPIQVRDISELPATDRRRSDGGHYKWELICGEGRVTAFQELGERKIPALVIKAPQAEIVGRFLAENLIRKPLPWAEKGRLVKAEIDDGATPEQVAQKFGISLSHVTKLQRVVSKTATGLEDDVAAMPMNEAEVFTTLPPGDQAIVVELLRENPERQVRDVMRKAREVVAEGSELSATALRQSLKRVDDDLKALRDSLKLARLHSALGPGNLVVLLHKKKFREALKAARVNVSKFEEVSAS